MTGLERSALNSQGRRDGLWLPCLVLHVVVGRSQSARVSPLRLAARSGIARVFFTRFLLSMPARPRLAVFLLCIAALSPATGGATSPAAPVTAPKPLFDNPDYHGSCDPEVVWNESAKEWWIFYTARRSTRETGTYVGNPIGVIASADLHTWRNLGYASFDGLPGKPDMPVTFWAPGIVRQGDIYHMFVTYKPTATPPWGGDGEIRHYVAPAGDLLNGWKLSMPPNFPQPDPIDATLIQVGDTFRAYYRVGRGGGIQWSTSTDLRHWEHRGACPGDINAPAQQRGFDYQEAPFVFKFRSSYWLLTDPHKGLAVYQSPDGITWKLQGRILERPGTGSQDATPARHPSVAVIGDRAFLFYHTEPNRPYPTPPPEKRTVTQKISFLQIAELKIVGGQLTCDRDTPVTPPAP